MAYENWLKRAAAVAAVLLAFSTFVSDPSAQQAPAQEEKKEPAKDEPLPLKPNSKIEFTTDEGSWLSLDLSPDGRTIVFELLGDLYTLPITGGTATRITSGQAYDMQPRYSPDGARLVFVSDQIGRASCRERV